MDHTPPPPADLLARLFHQLPVLIVHLTPDGILLHMNSEAVRATGYTEAELAGKNFWAHLFPGRLFAQVPKFVSAIHPLTALTHDIPMTLRTKDGKERVVAWSRFVHDTGPDPSIVIMGKDLTDRLLASDNLDQPAPPPSASTRQPVVFGPPVGNLGTVDGDIITPLAISPRTPPNDPPAAIQQVHEFLTEIDRRIDTLQSAADKGEIQSIATLAARLSDGAHACGLLEFSSRAESLRQAAETGSLQSINTLVQEIVTLCRPHP